MNPSPLPPKKPVQSWLKYTGLGIQMLVIIALGTFGGLKIDEALGHDGHIFTIILSLLSVILAMGLVVKDFIRKKPK